MKKRFKSIRLKLFFTLCIIVLIIIISLILLNNFVLARFYLYNKKSNLKNAYSTINSYYNNKYSEKKIESELEKISVKNDFDIVIKNQYNETIYTSSKDFLSSILLVPSMEYANKSDTILESKERYAIREFNDNVTNMKYIVLNAILDNGYKISIRMPISPIDESVSISNQFLSIIAIFVIIFGGIVLSIVSRRFSKPIEELNDIAKGMSNLDFSKKYVPSDSDDEIDDLGNSINTLSEKLESTINQLKDTNLELEKDVEEKSKINEMRKSFISDVSHELKTPIALIQGYSEGLIENVNTDEESRKYYAEVILDEATKMDKLVKELLELMKLEYGKMEFNNAEFDIVELEKDVIKKSQVMIEKESIEVEFEENKPIIVLADKFYTEQVFTNYITNAIKYSSEINGKKKIKIINEVKNDKLRVVVFNTSEGLSEEELTHIWDRFYKGDKSRNRENGGTGIGLAFVKAVMNNYGNEFGAKNALGGVEFYFELNKKMI